MSITKTIVKGAVIVSLLSFSFIGNAIAAKNEIIETNQNIVYDGWAEDIYEGLTWCAKHPTSCGW